jgi:hypothetical protein
MQREVVGGIQLLAGDLHALAEVARGARLVDHLVGHRLARRADLLEHLEHLLVVDPVLQHLRRRLGEILRHVLAAVARIARRRQVVAQGVAELVNQGLELAQRQAAAIQRDDQRRLRLARHVRGGVAEVPDRGVVVLALARIRVHVQRRDLPVAGDVRDGPGLHVGRPGRGTVDLVVADAVHLLGHAHHEAQALLRREVGPERLLVDCEALVKQALGIEHGVPALQLGGVERLMQVARLGLAQFERFAKVAVGRRGPHLVEELRGVRRRLHHATPQHELVVAREAEQPGLFEPKLFDLRQQLQVVRTALVGLRAPKALARAGVLGGLHHAGVGRPVDGQRHLAVGVAGLILPHRLGHTLEFGIAEGDAHAGVADVAIELLAQPRELVGDGLRARLLVLGQRDAGVLERLQRALGGAPVDRILELGHRLPGGLVHLRVHAQRRLEVVPALLALLGLHPHFGAGMHVLQEDQRTALVLLPGVKRLPALEPVGAGLALLELLDAHQGALQAGGARRGDLRAVGELRKRQIGDRVLDHRLDRDRLRMGRRLGVGGRAPAGGGGVGRIRGHCQDGRQRQRCGNQFRSLHRVSGRMPLDRRSWRRPSGRAIVTACRPNFRSRCDQLLFYRPETSAGCRSTARNRLQVFVFVEVLPTTQVDPKSWHPVC